MVTDITNTVLIDIGARYGLHPSWKDFKGDLSAIMIDADPDEILRLQSRFSSRKSFHFINKAIVKPQDSGRTIFIPRLSNPAMTTIDARIDFSPIYIDDRPEDLKSTNSFKVFCSTLDETINEISPDLFSQIDFLKLDIEGLEFDALLGASSTLAHALGLRVEVSFDKLFEKSPQEGSFCQIHSYLANRKFKLVNIDYSGYGDMFSHFCDPRVKHGMLRSTDAVWVRWDFDHLTPAKVAKIVSFLFHNYAADLAIYVMKNYLEPHDFKSISGSKLWCDIKYMLGHWLYKLKWLPKQNLKEHSDLYEAYFDERYPAREVFNNSSFFNP